MKTWNYAFFLLVLAVLPVLVTAVPVQTISMTNCGLNAATYACSASITASCLVSTTYTGTVVTDVKFTIGDSTFSGSLSSGNTTNGTWTATVTNAANLASTTINLAQVQARVSDAHTCTGSSASDTAGCYVRFTAQQSAANTCSCQYTRIEGAVTTSNTQTVTIVPTAGCADQTNTTYTQFVDYCDPQWTPVYGACTGSNLTTAGIMTKSYESNNPACCTATAANAGYTWYNHNTGSDCVPPIDDGSSVSCIATPVTQKGVDAQHNFNTAPRALDFNTVDYSTYTAALDQAPQHPLSYDFDSDGNVEFLTFQSLDGTTASVFLRSDTLQLIASSSNGVNITGQPALAGVTQLDDGTFVKGVSGNPVLLVPIISSSIGRIAKYTVTSSGMTFNGFIANGSSSGFTGITCYYNQCTWGDPGTNQPWTYTPSTGQVITWSQINVNWNTTSTSFDVDTSLNMSYLAPALVGNATSSQTPMLVWAFNRGATGRVVLTEELGLTTTAVFNMLAETSTDTPTFTFAGLSSIGRTFVVSFKEDHTGTQSDYLGVYTYPVLDTFAAYGVTRGFTASKLILWRNQLTTSDEGISNPVSADHRTGYVQISTRSVSLPTAGSAFTAPQLITATPNQPTSVTGTFSTKYQFLDMTPDLNYFFWAGGTDGTTVTAASTIRTYRSSTGAVVSTAQSGGTVSFPNSWRSLTYDQDSEQLEGTFGCNSICTGGGGGTQDGRAWCLDAADPTALTSTPACTSWNAMTVICFNTGFVNNAFCTIRDPVEVNGVDYLPTNNRQPGNTTNPAEGITATSNASVFTVTDTNAVSGLSNSDYRTVGYDAESDTLITQSALIDNFAQGPGFTNQQSLPSSMPGGSMAFNFDWITPRYINTAGNKVKITSTNPLVTTTTGTSCGAAANWTAIYYNADRHILGVHLTVVNSSGGSIGPKFAYCDFSDESAPRLTEYDGVYLPNGGTPTITGTGANATYTWPMPVLRVKEFNNDRDGTGDTLVEVAGLTTTGLRSLYGITNSPGTTGFFAYSIDTSHEPATSSASEQTRVVKFNTNPIQTGSLTKTFNRRSFISMADFTGDEVPDVIGEGGAFDFINNQVTLFPFNINVDTSVIPVDANMDGALDMIVSGQSTALSLYISAPPAEVLTSGQLAVINFRCSQIPGTSNVNFQLAASAPTPDSITVAINPGDGRGLITQSPTSLTGSYVVSYAKPGAYTGTVRVTSVDSSTNVATSTCNVNVTGSAQVLTGSDCSLGTDGEFQYADSIVNHGWTAEILPTGVSANSLKPSNGKLFLQNGRSIKYDLNSCGYSTITLEAKLIPSTVNGDTAVLQMIGTDPSDIVGLKLVSASSGDSAIQDEEGNIIGQFTADGRTYHIISIALDRANGQVYYYLDGEQLSSKMKTLDVDAIRVVNVGLWDYVRVAPSGGKLASAIQNENPNVTPLDGDAAALLLCDNDALQAADTLEERRSYTHIETYCSALDSGVCDFSELSMVASRYNECAKEAYNYCVYKAFNFETGSVSTSGIAGGTSCAALITGSAAIGQIVAPTAAGLWNIVADKFVWVLVAVGVLVVIAIILRRRR